MRRWALIAVLALCGCGPRGPLFLTIEGELGQTAPRVPDDVDQAHVLLTDVAGANTLYDRAFTLNADEHRFPLTLALEPSARTPAEVRVVVTLSHADTPRGGSEAIISLNRGQVNQATVRVVLSP